MKKNTLARLLKHSSRSNYFLSLVFLLLAPLYAAAQSSDVGSPTPVTAREISGIITPRDIGDARLTRHFYILTGTPGDLNLTVTSNNLNGDVDLFTAEGLRPLFKVSMYAGVSASSTTKGVYLRARQQLILRVEARTPNDNEGTYSLRFDGAFEPMPAPAETAAETTPATTTPSKGGRRVSSAGARIEEPKVEEPAKTVTEATRATTETPTPAATDTAPEKPVAGTTSPATRRTTRAARNRPRASTATRTRTPPAPRTTTARRSTPAAENPKSAEPEKPAEPVAPEINPRLIIETKDGMRVERLMSTVRRVTVENGMIVVVLKDGKVERQPMTNVQRMAIEP